MNIGQAVSLQFLVFLGRFDGAFIAQAKHSQAVIFRHNIGAGINQGFELRIRNMDAFYFLAAAAIQLLMILLRALKTVCFAGDGNTPHFANINQRIQVAVNGAKAQPRAHCPQRRTDLLRGWIIAARKYLPQNQFTLMRLAQTKNLLLIQCRGKNSKYFSLHIVYMIPVPYHIK